MSEICEHCGKPNDIQECVDCEGWFSESELFPIFDENSFGKIKYYLCTDCYREDLDKRRE